MLPGCFAKSMSRLSSFTRLTVLAIVAAVCSVVVSFFIEFRNHSGEDDDDFQHRALAIKSHPWIGVMVICLCYSYQQVQSFNTTNVTLDSYSIANL